jgi:hypothetical protein
MDTSDVTIEILKNIRDEIRGTRQELRDEIRATREELGARIDDTNRRLGTLERRQVEAEVRLSTEIVTLVGVVREVRDAIRDDRVSRVRVDDHERRITTLEKRST